MRKYKWLRRGAYVLGFVLVLYLLFWWALFNPLEGSIDRLDQMIPGEVRYLVHGPWGKLRQARLYQSNFLDAPVRTEIERALELEEYFYLPVRDIEAQINESIPGILGEFSILEDVAGREVAIAGVLSGEGEELEQKILNSPWIVLTRISYKARFMEVLDYEFVREQIPNLRAYRDYFEYDVGEENVREGAPEEARFYYFARIKDVLVLANNRELLEKSVRLGLAQGGDETLERNYWYYWDLGELPTAAGLNLWGRVAQTDLDLGGALEEPGRRAEGSLLDFVRALFPVEHTTSITMHFGVEDEHTVPVSGAVRMTENPSRETLPDRLVGLHRHRGVDLEPPVSALGSQVPVERTFALVWLKMAPRDFLLTIIEALDPATREMLFGAGGEAERKMVVGSEAKQREWNEERMASQVGDWFEEGVGLAFARLPEVDEIDLDTWDGGVPLPYTATTVFLKVKARLSPDDLVSFFEKNRDQFGYDLPEEKPSATGRMFVLRKKIRSPTDKLIQPAFAVLDHEFIFSSNAGELARVLEVVAGKKKSMADGEAFPAALARAHEKGTLFAFIDVKKQLPYILDQRWQWAFDSTYFDAKDFRKRIVIDLNRKHTDWTTLKINEEADREVERRMRKRQEVEFPEAVAAYKERMFWYEPFSWLSLSMSVSGDRAGKKVEVRGAIRLSEAKE